MNLDPRAGARVVLEQPGGCRSHLKRVLQDSTCEFFYVHTGNLDPRDLAWRSSGRPHRSRSAPPPPPAPPAATAARPPTRPPPPPFPEPALNAPGSEARAARGATTDSTSDPRA